MEKSQVISDFVKLSKADKRLANKKRKAEVLLNLLSEKQRRKRTKAGKEEISSKGESDVSPAKKSRVDQEFLDSKYPDVTDENKLRMLEKRRLKRQRLKEIRTQIKKLQKQNSNAKERPIFHLALENLLTQQLTNQSETVSQSEELPPLYMLDLQHLLLLGLLPDSYIHYPRWCKLARPGKVRSVIVIVLNQLCALDLEEYQACFPFMKKTFSQFADIVSPYQYGSTVLRDIVRVPVSITSLKNKSFKKDADRDVLKQQISEIRQYTRPPRPDVVQEPTDFNRKHLLLNPLQLMHEGYPMPIRTLKDRYRDFRFSCDSYKAVTKRSPMFAIDCEMCLTTAQENELTRISVVNEKLETVYDTLVKPRNKIINYLTQYSGITKKMLDPVKTRLHEVQEKLRQLLPSDAIWLGQSLNNDLIALKLFHPYVIDTSVIYNLSGFKWKKTGLKVLTAKFLKQDIQMGSEGHSPVEDARATMELVQLKLKKGMTFGDATLSVVDSDPEESSDTEVKETSETVEKDQDQSQTVKLTNDQINDERESLKVSKNQSEMIEDKSETDGNIQCYFGTQKKNEKTSKTAELDHSETSEQTIEKSETEEGVKVQTTSEEKKGFPVTQIYDKRRLFFQQQQGKYQSFFSLAKNGKKSAVVIDREEDISDIVSDPGVKCIMETSDRARMNSAVKAVQCVDFVWVHLHALGNVDQSEECKEKERAVSRKDSSAVGNEGVSTSKSGEDETTVSEDNMETGEENRMSVSHAEKNVSEEYEEGEIIPDEWKMKCLKRLDKRVKKLVQKVQPRSLLCVVLSGQASEDSVQNGGVLIKIT